MLSSGINPVVTGRGRGDGPGRGGRLAFGASRPGRARNFEEDVERPPKDGHGGGDVDPIEEFFHRIAARGRDNRLAGLDGTLRVDLQSTRGVEHWLVTARQQNIQVSQHFSDADVVVATNRELFVRVVRGEIDYLSAWLRNEVRLNGNFLLLQLFRIFLPDKVRAQHPRDFAQRERQP